MRQSYTAAQHTCTCRCTCTCIEKHTHRHKSTYGEHGKRARRSIGRVGACAQLAVDLLVLAAADRALAEVHDVLGERARLVGEEELDLAQLLVDVRRVRLGRLVDVGVVHLEVPLEEELAAELHQLCKPTSHAYILTCYLHF